MDLGLIVIRTLSAMLVSFTILLLIAVVPHLKAGRRIQDGLSRIYSTDQSWHQANEVAIDRLMGKAKFRLRLMIIIPPLVGAACLIAQISAQL